MYGTVRWCTMPTYKHHQAWRKQKSTGSIGCNNATFGDPMPGYSKKCLCESDPAIPDVATFQNFKDSEDEHFQNFNDEYDHFKDFDFVENFASNPVSIMYRHKIKSQDHNQYFIKPQEKDFICDILIVGGGGGGGGFGGGGGGGEVLFGKDVKLNKGTKYVIYVGNGGAKAKSIITTMVATDLVVRLLHQETLLHQEKWLLKQRAVGVVGQD